MKLAKKYEWRELVDSQDGRGQVLRELNWRDYKYDIDRLSHTFDSEEDAVQAFLEFRTANEYARPYELVLITLYREAQDV